jgi:hypothetical protein
LFFILRLLLSLLLWLNTTISQHVAKSNVWDQITSFKLILLAAFHARDIEDLSSISQFNPTGNPIQNAATAEIVLTGSANGSEKI